jgi:hypothetical protein
VETSPIYELLPAFNERSHLIYMLLGLLSMSQDWMRLLESEAQNARLHESGLKTPPVEVSSPDTSGKGFLYFLLGTISFTDYFTRALESARSGGQPPTPDDLPGMSWGDLSELLR